MKLYWILVSTSLKSQIEYRFSFFMTFLANIVKKIAEYACIWIILSKFDQINGWDFWDILLLYNINQFATSLSGLILQRSMRELDDLVRTGALDSLLVRPIGLLPHLIIRVFDFTYLPNLSLSVFFFFYCFVNSSHIWDIMDIMWLLVVIIGAVLIYSAVEVFAGAFSFLIVKSATLRATILGFRNFIFYPISIYNKGVQIFLTFVFPIAFANYYPLKFLLNKTECEVNISPYVLGLSPLIIGPVLFILSYLFFCYGVNKYQSAGS